MADSTRMLAGIVAFVLVVYTILASAAEVSPALQPTSTTAFQVTWTPFNFPAFPSIQTCGAGGIPLVEDLAKAVCSIGAVIYWLANFIYNGLVTIGSAIATVFNFLWALLTFNIPLLDSDNPLLIAIQTGIRVIIGLAVVLFLLRFVRSFFPFVSGSEGGG